MIDTILITGCSRGLGYALATSFAQNGQNIYAVSRDEKSLEQLKAEYPELIQPIVADIATEVGRQAVTERVMRTRKPLSIIHNAGIANPIPFNKMNEKILQEHFATNVFAPLLITQQCLQLLTGQRVIHISSGAAELALADLLPYCASKAALDQSTRCINKELNSHIIYCANLRPGMVDTPMQENFRSSAVLSMRDFYVKAQDQKQLINPSLAAKFVKWVLLNTDNNTFSSRTWNIYDPEQHRNWVPVGTPAPSFKMVD